MNNENEFFVNDVEANVSEEEIVLAPPTELIEEAKEIEQNTKTDEKFPFDLQYDANQKEFLLSMLETVGAVVEADDEDGHVLSAMLNMTQLAFIKRLDAVERVKNDEGNNPFLAEEAEAATREAASELIAEPMQAAQVMTLAMEDVAEANADDSIAVACEDGTGSCCCPSNDSMATAQTIAVETMVSGYICCPGAEQWFKVTLPRATQYTIFTTGSLDTVGALYDAAGNKLYEVDDYAGKLNFRITAILAGGVPYYIGVREAKQQTGNYQLKVTEKILVDSVSVTPSTIVLDMGKKYELPVSLNTRLNPSGVDWIDGLNVSISPANATETKIGRAHV